MSYSRHGNKAVLPRCYSRNLYRARAKAMEYANGIPCLNALAQPAGRLLRSPEDKGIIVIMDGRAAGRFKQRIPKDSERRYEGSPQHRENLGRNQKLHS